MKTWQRWLLGIGGFLVLAYIAGVVIYSRRGIDYHTGKPVGYVMEGGQSSIHWAKNSQGLYFTGDGQLKRYELRTGRTTIVLDSATPIGYFDSSSDDTKLLSGKRHQLGIFDLKTRRYTPLPIQQYLGVEFYAVRWPADNRILLYVKDDRNKPAQLRLIDPVRRTMLRIPVRVSSDYFVASDGSGLGYCDPQRLGTYYYNFAQNRARQISPRTVGCWHYLSQRYAIYDVLGSGKMFVTDLTTMTSRPFTLPITRSQLELSPDMTKYYYVDDESGSFDFPYEYDAPYHIFIADTPADELQKLTK